MAEPCRNVPKHLLYVIHIKTSGARISSANPSPATIRAESSLTGTFALAGVTFALGLWHVEEQVQVSHNMGAHIVTIVSYGLKVGVDRAPQFPMDPYGSLVPCCHFG